MQVLDGHAVAVHLKERFHAFARGEMEALVALRSSLGDVVDEHDDARGVYIYPSVAKPKAATYEGIVDEIGEAGVWVVVEGEADDEDQVAPEQMGQLMAQLTQAIPPDVLMELQRAMLTGDMAAMARAQQSIPNLEALAANLQQMFPGVMEAAQSMMGQQPSPSDESLDLDKVLAEARRALHPMVDAQLEEASDEAEADEAGKDPAKLEKTKQEG